MALLYITIAFILNAAGNILFKVAANRGIVFHGSLINLFSKNYILIFGFVLYAINALFYALALKSLPLSIAYPIMVVMSLLIITIFSISFLHENINTIQIIGYLLLVLSVFLIFYFSNK